MGPALKYASRMVILRPHPWAYHPIRPAAGTSEAPAPAPRARRRAIRSQACPLCEYRLRAARWLGLR